MFTKKVLRLAVCVGVMLFSAFLVEGKMALAACRRSPLPQKPNDVNYRYKSMK